MESEPLIRLGGFLGIFGCMALWEIFSPKRRPRLGRRRWPANLGMVAIDALVVRLLFPAGMVGIAVFAAQKGWGLFHLLPVPSGLALAGSIVLLDLTIYGQHILFHRLPILWRLHMVHHADPDIDLSTGLRFHPVEILLSMLIKATAVILLGAPAAAVLIFEIVLNGMAMFNHANINLPHRLDRLLRMLIVTPDMHRVHHSVLVEETNSNFGFNLSCWDRLFATYRRDPAAGHDGMTIGLAQFQKEPRYGLGWMLALPFTGRPGNYPDGQREERRGTRTGP